MTLSEIGYIHIPTIGFSGTARSPEKKAIIEDMPANIEPYVFF
jgi:hypothetical protein